MEKTKLKLYLAGPMSGSPDLGHSWRLEWIEIIDSELPGMFEYFNPADPNMLDYVFKTYGLSKDDIEKPSDDLYGSEVYRDFCASVVREDLAELTTSDIVFVSMLDAKSAGTIGELSICRLLDIPTCVYVPSNVKLGVWLTGCVYNPGSDIVVVRSRGDVIAALESLYRVQIEELEDFGLIESMEDVDEVSWKEI